MEWSGIELDWIAAVFFDMIYRVGLRRIAYTADGLGFEDRLADRAPSGCRIE